MGGVVNRSRIVVLALLIAPLLHAQESASCDNGLALFQTGDFAAAQDLLWKCIESRAGNENDAFYLALTYRPLQNYASGLARVNRMLKEMPDNVDLLYIAAYLHYRQNETKDSMILTSKAYRLAPKDWRIQQLFALNYISFNMLEAAKLSLQEAIALKPDNAELEYQLARLYFTQGNYVASIETSKKALAIIPDYPEVYHNLALSYEGSGNVELALQSFQKAIELGQKYKRRDELPLIDFADYERMLGHPEASVTLLNEALNINPDSQKANYEVGELLADMHKYDEAKKYLEIALKLEPCNAATIYGLAIVTRRLGDAARSQIYFEQFRQVNKEAKEQGNDRKTCLAADPAH